jgi:hypothetical protein
MRLSDTGNARSSGGGRAPFNPYSTGASSVNSNFGNDASGAQFQVAQQVAAQLQAVMRTGSMNGQKVTPAQETGVIKDGVAYMFNLPEVDVYPNGSTSYDIHEAVQNSLDNLDGGYSTTIPFNGTMPSFLMVEGVGIGGTYNINGTVSIDNNQVGISASGYTAASSVGEVKFSGSARLIVDGKAGVSKPFNLPNSAYLYETGRSPIGTATFPLPSSGNVFLEIGFGYTFFGPEGPSVPIPSQIHFTIPIFNQRP